MSEIFFSAENNYGWGLYETDGTPGGTKRLANYTDYSDVVSSEIRNIYGTATGSMVAYFTDGDTRQAIDFYSTSGVRERRITLASGQSLEAAYSDGTSFYYVTYGGSSTQSHLYNIYRSDGTAAGTKLLQFPGGDAGGSSADDFFSWKGSTWISYLQQGSVAVARITGDNVTTVFNITSSTELLNYQPLGNKLLFYNYDSRHGYELWVSDGTTSGTHLLKDINAGLPSSNVDNRFAILGDKAFFVANDGKHGEQVWVTDGTAAGTRLLKDLGTGISDMSRTAVGGNQLYFLQYYTVAGSELTGYNIWRTDGTAGGTNEVKMTYQGHGIHAIPTQIATLGESIIFEGFQDDDQASSAIYSYDTKNGQTTFLVDTAPGYDSATSFTRIGNNLIFYANSPGGSSNIEMWITDGTAAGTHQINEIYPSGTGSSPTLLTRVGKDDPDSISLSSATVKENSNAGTVIGTLSSTDLNLTGKIAFSLVDNTDGVFTIKEGKLEVAAGAKLDYEVRNAYAVTVRATDAKGTERDKSFIINITDVVETITGTAAANTIKGGAGADLINGLAGNDTLYGYAGDDKVTGGAGADSLYGGAGSDTFIYTALSDSTVAASGRDTIHDFTQGADRINLSALDSNTKLPGNQAFTFVGTQAFDHNAGEIRYAPSGADTIVSLDVNGDAKADFSIKLVGSFTLTSADFIR